MRQQKALVRKGLREADEDNPFELFISSTEIRYCYYKESHKILGQTYGMLVLQVILNYIIIIIYISLL
jgi:N-acetyltransferase 10